MHSNITHWSVYYTSKGTSNRNGNCLDVERDASAQENYERKTSTKVTCTEDTESKPKSSDLIKHKTKWQQRRYFIELGWAKYYSKLHHSNERQIMYHYSCTHSTYYKAPHLSVTLPCCKPDTRCDNTPSWSGQRVPAGDRLATDWLVECPCPLWMDWLVMQ